MHKTPLFFAIVLAAAVSAGCQDNDDPYADNGPATRREGDLLLSPASIQSSPYSPIMGDTTGGGLPRNRMTGGGMTGNESTPLQDLNSPTGLPGASAPVLPPATQPAR